MRTSTSGAGAGSWGSAVALRGNLNCESHKTTRNISLSKFILKMKTKMELSKKKLSIHFKNVLMSSERVFKKKFKIPKNSNQIKTYYK